MKKLLVFTTFLLLTALNAVMSYGQISNEDLRNPPKTDAEVIKYIDKYLSPQINDTLIARLFEEADVVFEGEIIESTGFRETRQALYEFEPYKVFKGKIQKDSTLKIMTYPAPVDVQYLGEWSHGRSEVGVFFIKKNKNDNAIYHFVNPKNAWVVYPKLLIGHPIIHEQHFKKMFYDKILAPHGAKYEKTRYYHKKKENLTVGNTVMKSGSGVITGFSRDTVPAGVLSGASRMTIYGDGFGSVKGNVLMEDANQANIFVALHPIRHILYWSDDSIQVIVPAMGFASSANPDIGDTRKSCAGTGYVRVIKGTGLPIPIWSDTELIIPYAIKNYAENSAFENLYTPYEVRLRNANGQGGYTFVYDTSFYNNAPALAAFRRSLKTWRCATGIHLKDICIADTLCRTDESSTRILVSFAKSCFATTDTTVLATTYISQKLDTNCPQATYFTDSISLAFRPQSQLLYSCPTGTCPAVWNYDTLPNSAANAYNFEKVATHELGHVFMLQHVIDSTSLMHFDTHPGTSADANLKTLDATALQGMNYIVRRDTAQTTLCATPPLILLSPSSRCGNLPGSGKTDQAQDETPYFVDLQMRDNAWDTGQEPNLSGIIDADGDGVWSLTSPIDWEDIWASPDLWNCDTTLNCSLDNWHNPRAIVENKMGFTIRNASNIVSDTARLHLHYSLANTGEMWPQHWVNFWYQPDEPFGEWCYVGEEIAYSPVTIPPIYPQQTWTNWVSWWPPNFVAPDSIISYQNPNYCGLVPETNPADGQPKYELCLLARLESAQDPIMGDNDTMSIRDYTLNSNNVVTRNTFLIDPAIGSGLGMPPLVPGQPSIMLMANNNDEIRYLDLLFEQFSNGSVEALGGMLEISFVLSPELWDKWESTGKQGEGVQIIGEREVRITDMETARLLDIPFDPREFQPFAIKVTILTNSGKQETLNLLPNNFSFRITHSTSRPEPINKPSSCFFSIENWKQQAQTAQALSQQLICSPNPFSHTAYARFWLESANYVSLDLYDLQGRLVKRLLTHQFLAQGEQQIAINSTGLSSGLYLLKLTTAHKQISQKIVVTP
jgi:hypothetical protein